MTIDGRRILTAAILGLGLSPSACGRPARERPTASTGAPAAGEPTAGEPAAAAARREPAAPQPATTVSAQIARLPLRFEANQGQFSDGVSFVARGRGYELFLTPAGATLAVGREPSAAGSGPDPATPGAHARQHRAPHAAADREPHGASTSAAVAMHVVGGRPVRPSGVDRLAGPSNYFVGPNRSRWRTGVAAYARVRYRDVRPGLDLVFYGAGQRALEYDLVLAPGAPTADLALAYEGATSVDVDSRGDLVLRVGGAEILQAAPNAYQRQADGSRVIVAVHYQKRADGAVGFALGPHDPNRELVIDPTLFYSTYFGGSSGADSGSGIAVDGAGTIYVTGTAYSIDFPTLAPFQANNAGSPDIFIAKLSSTGALLYSTFLGGSSVDLASGIVADSSGAAYVAGTTYSSDFPTLGAAQPVMNGLTDAFVAKLNSAGALTYASYLGGADYDAGAAVALDSAGAIYVAGTTSSTDFPTLAPLQPANHGSSDAFITKLTRLGALVYSTYLGGTSDDYGYDLAVDAAGAAYLAGSTSSTDFPLKTPVQATLAGVANAFVAKLNPAGSSLVYSTYLGGSSDTGDSASGIAVDTTGAAFVTGIAASANFPTTASAFQRTKRAPTLNWNAFVTKFNPAGTSLAYSSYLGGTCADSGARITVDTSGQALVAGQTCSPDFPTVGGPVTPFHGPAGDFQAEAFVSRFSASGSSLIYSSYLGGNNEESATSIAVDAFGATYLTGWTYSDDFPTTTSAIQQHPRALQSAFIAKLVTSPMSVPAGTALWAACLAVILALIGARSLLAGDHRRAQGRAGPVPSRAAERAAARGGL